nr:ExeM/NucH family extracellular endonuclease [Acidobacteriota bacterium]
FNVLNYFNGDGLGGGFPTSRGATTAAEFARQRSKIIAAIIAINADVYGIIEIENDGNGSTSAIQDLVNGLNDATAAGTYAFREGTTPGTDEIKNSIIYKTTSVTPVGPAVNDDDPVFTGQARNPLAQTFTLNSNSEKFTFIVNHFTSKGCSASDTGADADQGDGQGCDNFTRTEQSKRLLVFVNNQQTASGDNDVLVMGDLNAYGEEDPIIALEEDATDALGDGPGGLINEVERFVPAPSRYTFQFQSKFGYLDHALATKELDPRISGTTIWHINADEPVYIDYNVEFKSAAQQAVNQGTPFKSSDHDPVIVGVNLTSAPAQVAGSLIISEFRFRGPGSQQVEAPQSGGLTTFGGSDGPRSAGPVSTFNAQGPNAVAVADTSPEANDEFIEFYNNTNTDITVSTIDGSAGWALVASDGQIRFIIKNGTVIPARGHFLGVNGAGYSLSGYRAGDDGAEPVGANGDQIFLADGSTLVFGYTLDIPDNSGIALFRTANPANFNLTERLDAAGYAGVPELYREGAGFPTGGSETTQNLEYTFFRDYRPTGNPKDTGNNATDFLSADTSSTPGLGLGQKLGAPGPENSTSPIERSANFPTTLLNPSVSSSTPPNRVRKTCGVAEECDPNRSQFGTMSIRRTVTNSTGSAVAQLRFRIVEITTFPRPNGAIADIRALSSSDIVVTVNGNPVDVRGTTVEQPPSQPFGGGWNSSLNVGFITLAQPLPDGQSVSVQFLLGVQQTGNFKFFLNIEAQTESNGTLRPTTTRGLR